MTGPWAACILHFKAGSARFSSHRVSTCGESDSGDVEFLNHSKRVAWLEHCETLLAYYLRVLLGSGVRLTNISGALRNVTVSSACSCNKSIQQESNRSWLQSWAVQSPLGGFSAHCAAVSAFS
jgi:hypothetical protein